MWDGTTLSFMAIDPSTEDPTRNAFRLRSDCKADVELTFYEEWEKTEPV